MKIKPLSFSATPYQGTIAGAVNAAIPVGEDGQRARVVMISTSGGAIFFNPQVGAAATASSDMHVLPQDEVLILNVSGFDTIRLQDASGTPLVTVSPLENRPY